MGGMTGRMLCSSSRSRTVSLSYPLVGQHRVGRFHRQIEQLRHGAIVGDLAACQDEAKRAPLTVTAGVDLARKAAAASTKALLAGPPLAPAA